MQFRWEWWDVAALTIFCEMTVLQPNFHFTERYTKSAQKGQRFNCA